MRERILSFARGEGIYETDYFGESWRDDIRHLFLSYVLMGNFHPDDSEEPHSLAQELREIYHEKKDFLLPEMSERDWEVYLFTSLY